MHTQLPMSQKGARSIGSRLSRQHFTPEGLLPSRSLVNRVIAREVCHNCSDVEGDRPSIHLVNILFIRDRTRISPLSPRFPRVIPRIAPPLPYFLCIFLLTSTGSMPQIEHCQQEFSPKSFLFQDLRLYGGPALALPQPDGHDSCPGRFKGSRPL